MRQALGVDHHAAAASVGSRRTLRVPSAQRDEDAPDTYTTVARDLPDFVAFMLATGLRMGEASAITWDALDLDAGTVEVRGTVIRLKGQGLVLTSTTKSSAGMSSLCRRGASSLPSSELNGRPGSVPFTARIWSFPRPKAGLATLQRSTGLARMPRLVWAAMGHESRLPQDHSHAA